MGAAAPIGAGAMVAGTALNAYGQNQALDAMRDVWGNARAQQAGYDQAINQRQQQMLAQIDPNAITGAATKAKVGGQMDAAARNATAAVQKQAGRRRGNAEGKAVAQQAQGGQLAQLLRSGKLAAMIQGLQGGGQNLDMLGRQMGLDTNVIRGDARQAASVVPMYENAAAMQGAWARQGGQLLSGLGQFGVMAGMAASPAGATSTLNGMPYEQAALTEMPVGGWAASTPGLA